MSTERIHAGVVYQVKHPFVRDFYKVMDEEGGYDIPCWNPGTKHITEAYGRDRYIAHGEGLQILTVIGTYKPGKYAERVFYTRIWENPDGRAFGNNKVHMCSLRKFAGLIQGYRYEYTLVTE